MIDKVIICLFLLLVSIGCSSIMKKQNNFPHQKDITEMDEGHGNPGSISEPVWVGTYEGILVGSDNRDIKIVVELRKNSTFIWTSESNSKKKEKHRGDLTIDAKGRVMTLRTKTDKKSFQFNGKTIVSLKNDTQSGTNGANDDYFLTKR